MSPSYVVAMTAASGWAVGLVLGLLGRLLD